MTRPGFECRSILGVCAVGCLAALAFSIAGCSSRLSATDPAPREESWWNERHRALVDRARQGRVDLMFVGDSITQGWNNNRVWKEFYEPRHAANFGMNGDGTQHILWRLQHGELDGIAPKLVVLLAGTNNLSDCSPVEIEEGVASIVDELRRRAPTAGILLLGIFPRGREPGPIRDKIRAVNERLARLEEREHLRFLDFGQAFLNEDGTLSPEIMPDYLHPNPRGYRIWAEAMEPTLREMLDEENPPEGEGPPGPHPSEDRVSLTTRRGRWP